MELKNKLLETGDSLLYLLATIILYQIPGLKFRL